MAGEKVLLAFSGGIDSSEAARILTSQGYSVTALTLDMTGDRELVESAREKAAQLGVDFVVADVREDFRRTVIDYFNRSYLSGRTPAPCTVCNPGIKWKTLFHFATQSDFNHIATGHYFRISQHNNTLHVTRAIDSRKDQSYYLWGLPQDVLRMALAPMGEVIKENIRRRHDERESMGVCFLRGGDYRTFLSDNSCPVSPGEIVDKTGTVIGRHDGFPLYTTGQKRGLGLSASMCVTGIDAANNRIIAGTDEDLYFSNLLLGQCNISDPSQLEADDINVVIRGIGRNPEGFCIARPEGDKLRIELQDKAWAPASGQPAVLYRGERVIGGGFIEKYF